MLGISWYWRQSPYSLGLADCYSNKNPDIIKTKQKVTTWDVIASFVKN